MATKQEFNVPRRKTLTTYGKTSRKRQPKATFSPTPFPPIPEDDSAPKHKATVTRHRPSLISSPSRDPPSPAPKDLDRTTDKKASPNGPENDIPSSGQKRKISQVYTSKGRAPPARADRHSIAVRYTSHPSRPSTSTSVYQTAVSSSRQRTRSPSSESMDIDVTEPKLSSPPPTPTLPRASRNHPKTIATKGSTSSTAGEKALEKAKQENVQQQIPLRFARQTVGTPKISGLPHNVEIKDRSTSQQVPDSVSKKRRKRLIDALVEQTQDEVVESDDETMEEETNQSLPSLSHNASDLSTMDSQPLPQTPSRNVGAIQAASTRTFARSSSALKFTYGQGRKVLEEDGDLLLESLALPEMPLSLKGRRLELGTPKKMAASKGILDDEDSAINSSPNSKLRDIHELKQAGANSRVADTMQDLADQIGSPSTKPSSSRRAALLQVAEKIKDKAFMRQCRDYGVEGALLKDIERETDIVSGYLILSILVTILAKWPSSHIQQLVRLEKPASMFARLLDVSQDIKIIARDRKSNLSRRNQISLIAVQSMLRELPIWGEARPSCVSPRSLVLTCLHLLVTKDVNAARDPAVFSSDVIKALFAVLSEAAESADHWDYPATAGAIDLDHALSILDFYAVSVAESQRASADWATRYLPIVADVFRASSQNVVPDTAAEESERKILEGSVLKLTINLANNSLEAPKIFVSKGLIPALAGSISSHFSRISASLSQDTWVDGILDSLVLRLGILINFAEHSSLVRQVINDCHHDGQQPVDELIRLFSENYRRTAEADSMETSHLNVAFGYLSVLLGYLALYTPVRKKIRSNNAAKSIGPLLSSLREFTTHHQKVEQSMDESDDSSPGPNSYTTRLQDLVRQLEDQAAYD
ncbi:hypothetical protein F4818DRAFT_371367 [Hypoxylon cercidicola]|nr:hypothetical protein F4818DRAFT_371367 [Hypoxylon cercidicola]